MIINRLRHIILNIQSAILGVKQYMENADIKSDIYVISQKLVLYGKKSLK